MNTVDLIQKKRDGEKLSSEDINDIITNFVNGSIPDYQMSALLMAIYLQGMDLEETFALTKAIIESGDVINLSDIEGIKVDKHSTGGVGDTVTLILGPLVASCGVPFVKMSGRGLGHTGGTLDKLESIPGFKIDLSIEDIHKNVKDIGISITSQTHNITPADGKLYALRDVTATVDNLSLISSSIMSKKIAMGNDAILLDVKVGSGAFMKSLDDAKALAKLMVSLGDAFNRETKAVITNMKEPLGKAIGNSLEVIEAIEVLKGNGERDLTELTLLLGALMLKSANVGKSIDENISLLKNKIKNGDALNKFKELVSYQHGDISYVEDPTRFELSECRKEIKARKSGYIHKLDALTIGKAAFLAGAGRKTKESKIDLGAGILLNKKHGDAVNKGDLIATIFTSTEEKAEQAREIFEKSVVIDIDKPEEEPLIYDIIED